MTERQSMRKGETLRHSVTAILPIASTMGIQETARAVAIVFNILLVLSIGFLLSKEGISSDAAPFVAVAFCVPISSLVALWHRTS